MSDEHHRGGHELEGVNAANLFKIFIGLGVVTLLAATAVVQWFYAQREELILDRAAEGSPFLAKHEKAMAADLEGIDAVAEKVAKDPALLAATAPPEGFVDPDGPKEAPPTPAPVEEAPAEEAPAEGDAPAGADAPADDPATPEEPTPSDAPKKEAKGDE